MERLTTIRPFQPSDIEAAAELEASSQPRPWSTGIFREELQAPGRTYLVVDDGGVVGFGGIQMVGDEAHVTNLLVSPDRRGEGLGRSLLVELIASAIEQGARHLTLEVRVRNQAARSLYSSLKLAPVGIRPGYYDDDDALILWVHDIDTVEYRDLLETMR